MYDKGYKVFGCQIAYINARFYEIVMKSGYYADCYCISMNPFKFPGKFMHITDIWAIELGIKEDFDYFGAVERDSLLVKCLSNIENKELIDKITEDKRPIVGVQLHTMSEGMDEGKNWTYKSIIEFADMARNNGITLINLSPNPYGEITGMIDASFLKKNEVFYLISKLDAVVGVDSFCGHMAALLGIPNITIWVKQYPDILNPYDQYYILRSFRPLRMNYSICTRTLKPENIKPELVFRRLQEVLSGDITLSKNRISAEETSAGVFVEMLDLE
ncbi:glycosyltransferase family 9 protein [Ruminiclostridium josui]|nr:glycosyltransferase family 9 protein [Ruminiclostridium josui]